MNDKQQTNEDEEELSLEDQMAQAKEEQEGKCNELLAEVLYNV